MKDNMKTVEAVLVTVLVQRGNITTDLIQSVVNQFNVVFKFTRKERKQMIAILEDRFILAKE